MSSFLLLFAAQVGFSWWLARNRRGTLASLYFAGSALLQTLPNLVACSIGGAHFPHLNEVGKANHFLLSAYSVVFLTYLSFSLLGKRALFKNIPFSSQRFSPSQRICSLLFSSAVLLLPILGFTIPRILEGPYKLFSQLVLLSILFSDSETGGGISLATLFFLLSVPVIQFIGELHMEYFQVFALSILLVSLVSHRYKLLLVLPFLFITGATCYAVKSEFRLAVSGKGSHLIRRMVILETKIHASSERFVPVHFTASLPNTTSSLRLPSPIFSPLKKLHSLVLKCGTLLVRLSDSSFYKSVKLSPAAVPFWKGETYRDIPLRFIPHFLRSGELKSPWNDFGRRYFYLDSLDKQTSVGFNYFTEGYMNFGKWGILCVAIALGILLAVTDHFLAIRWVPAKAYCLFIFAYCFLNFGQPLGILIHHLFHRYVLILCLTSLNSLALSLHVSLPSPFWNPFKKAAAH